MATVAVMLAARGWERGSSLNFYYPDAQTRPHIHIHAPPDDEVVTDVYQHVTMLAVSSPTLTGPAGGITVYPYPPSPPSYLSPGARARWRAPTLTSLLVEARARLNGPFMVYPSASSAGTGAAMASTSWRSTGPVTAPAPRASTVSASTVLNTFNLVDAAP